MNMCQVHWDKLREAIRSRGLYRFVAPDGAVAARRAVDGAFDPLMNAGMAIFTHAMDKVGLHLMAPGGDGTPPCPLCFLKAQCPDTAHPKGECPYFETWIDRAADDQFEEAKQRGLVAAT